MSLAQAPKDQPLRRLWGESHEVAGRLRLGILLATGSLLAGVGLTATAAWLIARASQMPPVLSLGVAVVAVRAFGIARPVLRYLGRLASHDGALRLVADLRANVYERLIPLVPARLGQTQPGALLAGVVSDVDAGQDLGLRIVEPAAVAVLVSACCVAFTALLLPAAGIVLFCALAVGGIVAPLAAASAARRAAAELAPLRAELTAATVELLRGAPELIAFGGAQRALDEIAECDERLVRTARRRALATGFGTAIVVLASGAAVFGSAVAATPAVRDGRLAGTTMAVLVLLPVAAFEALAPLPSAAVLVASVRSAARSLFAVLDRQPAVSVSEAPVPLPSGPYTLRIANVTARWTDDASAVLANFDLELEPGARAVVEGRSGSGKTTIAMLLLRFLDPSGDGCVLLNGVDTRDVAPDDVRSVIGYVAEDAHIFASDLRENLRFARPEATDAELMVALQRVHLDDWFEKLPAGLDTMLGERGSAVSGGERRRIALARALLTDRPILVLDEPTEGLDVATATALVSDLLEAASDRTLIVLTHRTEGLDSVERRFRLVDGHLVAAPPVSQNGVVKGRVSGW
jgi:thiol reductant ABC exporter CydC subunit